MTEPTKSLCPDAAREEAALRVRRAVAKLVAAHSIPPGKFGRKRALRDESQRELACAIRHAPR
jgi:hypothetical protein